jgi:hypothetical protein
MRDGAARFAAFCRTSSGDTCGTTGGGSSSTCSDRLSGQAATTATMVEVLLSLLQQCDDGSGDDELIDRCNVLVHLYLETGELELLLHA